jgi:hypothetical protein
VVIVNDSQGRSACGFDEKSMMFGKIDTRRCGLPIGDPYRTYFVHSVPFQCLLSNPLRSETRCDTFDSSQSHQRTGFLRCEKRAGSLCFDGNDRNVPQIVLVQTLHDSAHQSAATDRQDNRIGFFDLLCDFIDNRGIAFPDQRMVKRRYIKPQGLNSKLSGISVCFVPDISPDDNLSVEFMYFY